MRLRFHDENALDNRLNRISENRTEVYRAVANAFPPFAEGGNVLRTFSTVSLGSMERIVTVENLTAALVMITAVYAYLTYRMAAASERSVKAAEDHLEASLRPYITIRPYVRPGTPFIYLAIINTGASGASQLSLLLDRDFFQFGEHKRPERNLRRSSAFSAPIPSFAPGQELHFGLGQGRVLFGKGANAAVTPSEFTITATYRFAGKTVEELHKIDLRPYASSEENRDPVLQELEKIRKTLAELVAAQQGPADVEPER